MNFSPIVFLLAAMILLACLGMMIWQFLGPRRTHRAVRLAIRKHEESLRTSKAGQDARSIVWDREVDG